MINVFIAVLNMSIKATVAALGVFLVRIPMKKAPGIFSYVLWTIVLFKLICPFSIESVRSLIPLKAEPIPRSIIYSDNPSIESGIRIVDDFINQTITNTNQAITNTVAPVQALPSDPVAAQSTNANIIHIILPPLSYIWLAGVMILLLYTMILYARLKYRLREAIPTQKNVYETDRIKTAFILGFISPKIYMPAGLTEQQADCILKHEQTHIKRLDHIIKPLAFLTVCIHWFNPVIWLSYHFAMRDMELSCDESVLKRFGRDMRRDYSNTLLSLAVKQRDLITPLAFGETGVKARIKNILKYKKPAVWVSILALIAVISAAVFLLTNTANDNEGPDDTGTVNTHTDNADKSGNSVENITEDDTVDNTENNTGNNKFDVLALVDYDDENMFMFDMTVKYRFDLIPFFSERNEPLTTDEYLPAADEAVPVFELIELTSSNEDGKTVYEAVMNHYYPDDDILAGEKDILTIRKKVLDGDFSSFGSFQRETFKFYLNNLSEPVFISHIMTDRPVLKWYYEMFRKDRAFKVLGSDTGDFSDDQLATYAILKLIELDAYNYRDSGYTKDELNAITQKYFGRNIKNFNNGMTEVIPGTDLVRATGWSFDNNIYMLAKDIWDNGDGTMTGDFYYIYISDIFWTGRDGEFEEAENAMFNGDISYFSGCFTGIRRIVYEVKEENGEQYFKYYSVKDIEHDIKSMVLYCR